MSAGLMTTAMRCAIAASVPTSSLYRGASALGRKHENARLSRATDAALDLTLDFKSTDLASGKSRTLRSFYRIGADGSCTRALTHDVTVDPAVRICIPSPDGRLQLRVCTEPGAGGAGTGAGGEEVLEVWAGSELLRRRPLAGKAGSVYADGVFGEPVFSPDGRSVAFLAEQLAPKSFASHFDEEEEDEGGGGGSAPADAAAPAGAPGARAGRAGAKGPASDKFRPRRDFGERLGGKAEPAVFVYDLEADELLVFERAGLGLGPEQHPAHVRFDASSAGLLFSAYERTCAWQIKRAPQPSHP